MPLDSIFRAIAIANWYRATRSFRSIFLCNLLPTGIGIAFTGAMHSARVLAHKGSTTGRTGVGMGEFTTHLFRVFFPPCHTARIRTVFLLLSMRSLLHHNPALQASAFAVRCCYGSSPTECFYCVNGQIQLFGDLLISKAFILKSHYHASFIIGHIHSSSQNCHDRYGKIKPTTHCKCC